MGRRSCDLVAQLKTTRSGADTSIMMGKRRWLLLVTLATMAIFVVGITAYADSGTEADFLAKINASRAAAGLAPLQVDGGLRAHARNHTADMVAAGGIFHSSESELKAAAGSGWDKIGENVGRGQSVESLHIAFMDSAGHKKNILGDYNYVGIGTDSSNGYLYVTVVFMKKGSTPSPTTTTAPDTTPTTAAAKAPTITKAPAPTTTTQPPTTTTTLIVPPDRSVTPGNACIEAGRYFQLCHD
ncbi:MAG: CAP domain-containing protein [Acidimicrobiia bacterium]